jgi:hypothetical protein
MPFAPRKLVDAQKAGCGQWLVLIDAHSSLGELATSYRFLTPLHETGTHAILLGHVRDGANAGLLANRLA